MRRGNVVAKVQVHAERRGGPKSDAERGNCVADAVAKGLRVPNVTTREVTVSEVLGGLRSLEFLLATEDDVDPDWRMLRQRMRLETYLRTRDQYKAQRGQAALWVGTSARLAGAIVKAPGSMMQRARFVRTVWDKHSHGGNKEKWGQAVGAA